MPAIDGYAAQRGRVAPAGSAIDPCESHILSAAQVTRSLNSTSAQVSPPTASLPAQQQTNEIARSLCSISTRLGRRRGTAADARVLVLGVVPLLLPHTSVRL